MKRRTGARTIGGLVALTLMGVIGCATKGYVNEEIARLSAVDEEIRADVDRAHAAASGAAVDAEAASREAGEARRFALGDVSLRETDRYVVTFAFDSAELSPDARSKLERAARAIAANPRYVADIYGYTDTIGDPAYNDMLSTWRASNVLRYLVLESHASLCRFAVVGLGETDPVRAGSEEDHEASRRVVVQLLERVEPESRPQVSIETRVIETGEWGARR